MCIITFNDQLLYDVTYIILTLYICLQFTGPGSLEAAAGPLQDEVIPVVLFIDIFICFY